MTDDEVSADVATSATGRARRVKASTKVTKTIFPSI